MEFTPFPNIETNSLSLTSLSEDDIEEIFFLRSNDEICRYVDHPRAESLVDAQKFIDKITTGIQNNEWIMWAIRLKGIEKLIGTICLWNFSEDKSVADIGFVLHPAQQRKGLMKEAVAEILKYGFSNLKLNEIIGEVVDENTSSIQLMKNFGFEIKKQNANIIFYSLKRTEKY